MKLEFEVPDSSLSALRKAPKEFTACLRLMAAAKLYEVWDLSQEKAAELAGQSRQDFLVSLSRLRVSPFQGVEEDFERTLKQLREKHGNELENWWNDRFGFGYDCLTNSEGRYLLRTPAFDRIRDRIAAAVKG